VSPKLRALSLVVAVILLSGFAAQAQDKKVEADRLFQQGRRLLDSKKVDEACVALAQSDQLDPAIGTLGLLAACHEQQGRIATAWREYEETAVRAQATNDPRELFARQRAAQLRPTLPTLTIISAGGEAGLTVTRNGEAVPPAQLGQSTPVDPGEYTIVARASGKKPYEAKVTVAAGGHADVAIPALEAPDKAVTSAPFASVKPPADESHSSPRPLRTAGFVAGGIGVAGLGVWAVTGILGLSKKSAAESGGCNRDEQPINGEYPCDTQEAADDANKASAASEKFLTVATVGLIVGGVGIAAGTAMLLMSSKAGTASRASRSTRRIGVVPHAGSQGGGATVLGTF
jgi:hypothetical protein